LYLTGGVIGLFIQINAFLHEPVHDVGRKKHRILTITGMIGNLRPINVKKPGLAPTVYKRKGAG
jgi:hypothetical protein